MKPTNQVLAGYGTTIFTVMSAMANEYEAINLGQGFPDEDGPDDILQIAADSVREGPNQYPPMFGIPELRSAIADHENRFYGYSSDPAREVLVTSGATEALAACMFALIEPGDEVILIEPAYDSYRPIAERAGAIIKTVRLTPPDWPLDPQELEAAFSDKTKLLILNNPMNPTGKLFGKDDLLAVASLLDRHDAYAICDEVYEHLVYPGNIHIPLLTLPGMAERVMRIGSAGKTFSLTGWKVGYVIASPALIERVSKAHQFLVFTTPPSLQKAVAYGFKKDNSYFAGIGEGLSKKFGLLADKLEAIGFGVMPCQAGYFLCADFAGLGFNGDDAAFCEYLTKNAGVTAIPVSAFYRDDPVRSVIRFCVCKREASLIEAGRRLEAHFA